MIKFVVLVKRKEGMSREEFFRYWIEEHAPKAKKIPGLRKYVISTSEREKDEYDGLAELWFDDGASMKKGFSSAEGEAVTKDAGKFASKRIILVTKEKVVL